jgi:hypothetical protein
VTDGLLAETDIDLFLVVAGDRKRLERSDAPASKKKSGRERPGFEFA